VQSIVAAWDKGTAEVPDRVLLREAVHLYSHISERVGAREIPVTVQFKAISKKTQLTVMKPTLFLTSTEYYHLVTSTQITPWVTHYLILPGPWV
jgi:hypothetical protein